MAFTAKNKYGLTHKQWMFAENYLQHFNADRAYREVYNGANCRNAWITLRSRPLIKYIRMRMEEMQATLKRNTQLAHMKLQEIMENGLAEEALEASKIVLNYDMKAKELETKYLELEKKDTEKGDNVFQVIINEYNEDNNKS